MEFGSIASGSSGNCIFASSDNSSVLIDTGISCKRIVEGLKLYNHKMEDLSGILITHEHSDHIAGLGVICRKYHIPVYATAATIRQIRRYSPLGKVDDALFRVIEPDRPFHINDLKVEAFRISHDAADPVAYRVESGNKAVAVATDMGCYSQYQVDHLQDLDAVLVESNHDENMLEVGPHPYPLKRRLMGEKGHLSNSAAGMLLCDILNDHMKTAYLGHLSKQNNYAALAYATVTSEIRNCWNYNFFDLSHERKRQYCRNIFAARRKEEKYDETDYNRDRKGYRRNYRQGLQLSGGSQHQYSGYFPDNRRGIFQYDDGCGPGSVDCDGRTGCG